MTLQEKYDDVLRYYRRTKFNAGIGKIIFFLLLSISANAQSNVAYEQKALDFFLDSIVPNEKHFEHSKFRFNGWVDSSSTYLAQLAWKYPNDSLLLQQYELMDSGHGDLIIAPNNIPFKLETELKKYKSKRYGRRSKVVRLIVRQNKRLGDNNYVSITAIIRDGSQGFIYFVVIIVKEPSQTGRQLRLSSKQTFSTSHHPSNPSAMDVR